MATGSIAAMSYGEYRVTNDLDVVVVLDPAGIARMARAFSDEDFYLPLACADYVVIRKLEFYREGRSEKHLHDIRGILAMTPLDRRFLDAEIAARGLADLWRAVEDATC